MENNLKSSFSFNEDDLITFQEGLFGFEQFKKFLPVSVEENNDAVLCLQSVEDEELSFVIMNPFFLKEDYDPQLSEADRDALGVTSDQELSYYVLCVAREPSEESTVNLKCPIAVNPDTRQARQVILDTKEYGFRHTLKELSDALSDKGGASC